MYTFGIISANLQPDTDCRDSKNLTAKKVFVQCVKVKEKEKGT